MLGRPGRTSSFLKLIILHLNLSSVHNSFAKRHSHHFKWPLNLIQFFCSLFLNSKKSKSTPKHNSPFHLSKTNWQSKMADIVSIYNRHVYQYNRKKIGKSNIRNSGNLNIKNIFWSHLVCPATTHYWWYKKLGCNPDSLPVMIN